MKSKFKLLCLSIMTLAAAAGCGGSKGSDSTSSTPTEYVSLAQAITNTSTYGITAESRLEDGWYIEVMLDNFFYYSPNDIGYIILEEDPNYFHVVSQSQVENADTISYDLNVHGRNGRASDFASTYSSGTFTSFVGIVKKYADDFFKVDENTYSSSVASIGDDLEEYFQTHSLTYTNYYEVDINKEGRIDRFRTYEIDGSYKTETMEIVIADVKLTDYKPYQRWNAAGRNIDVRLYDVKYGYMGADNKYVSVYQNETMEFEGVVTSIDSKGNYYIAKEDSRNGYIGIKVSPKNAGTIPSIGQTVTVKGTIKSNDFMVYMDQGEFRVTGSNAKYLPIFDEETIADNYGGGAYAYQMFCYAPYFSDSVYSTFAYVYEAPSANVEGQDSVITLACPNVDTTLVFYMRLILPKELATAKRDEILSEINSHAKYGTTGAEELSIQNTLVRFNDSYNYKVELEATAQSAVSKRPTPQEKIETVVGLANFPIPSVTGGSCFRFGGATGLFIEEYYGLDSTDTQGVYLNASSVSSTAIDTYLGRVESYGFSKVEEQMDIYSGRHSIYKYGEVVFDIWVQTGMSDGFTYYIWIYEGEVVRYKTIQEKVKESLEWFDVDDFVKLAGTYDADYNFYELTNYAGQDFSSDDPLRCVTLDLTEDRFSALREQYRAIGFTQSRTAGDQPYSYVTRGSSHIVYEKASLEGNEKIYIDMATYPTSDYTYSGHADFTYRIEILIYKGTNPLNQVRTNSMVEFSNQIVNKYGNAARLYADIPANSTVELVKGLGTFTTYGYNYNDEAFVYGDSLDAIESALIAGLTFSGYTAVYSTSRSTVYGKDVTDPLASYSTICYIFIMKETSRGYVRVANSLAGVDF